MSRKKVIILETIDLGQVFTKQCLADYMVNLFSLPSKSKILDPCFGGGVFINSILKLTTFEPVGFEIDKELYTEYAHTHDSLQLYCEDFLMCKNITKFDGIIMNPPYVRHEKIDDLKKYGITKAKLKKKALFSTLPSTANLYMYFIVKAMDMLKANGELVVIFPESWLNARSGKGFKKILQTNCSVLNRVHIAGDAFEKNALVDVVILKLIKTTSITDCSPSYMEISNNTIRERVFQNNDYSTSFSCPFKIYATAKRGVTTGDNSVFINPILDVQSELKSTCDIISSPKMIVGYSSATAQKDQLLFIQKDDSLDAETLKYLKISERKILKNGKPKTIANKIKNKEKWYRIEPFNCTGIIFGYMIRQDMRFIMNDSGFLVRDNFYVITPSIDYYLFFALLNNYYTYVQLEVLGKKYGGGLLKIQKYDIDELLFPHLDDISAEHISSLSELGNQLAQTGNKSVIDKITAILSIYEHRGYAVVKEQFEHLQSTRLERTL